MSDLKYRRKRKKNSSPLISREKIKFADDESTIIQYAIMHDKVCKVLVEYNNKKAFDLQDITTGYRAVYRRVIKYFKEYEKAPKRTVNLLFTKEMTSDSGIIPELLEGIAMEYEANKAGYTISPEFVIDSVLPRFVRSLNLNRLLDGLERELSNDNYKSAHNLVSRYEVPIVEDSESLTMFEPTKLEYYTDLFTRTGMKGDIMFEFKKELGDIGLLVGPLMKSWLVSVTGSTKSGKSAFLLDVALSAAYEQNKRVMIISPEMTEHDLIMERYIPWLVEIPYSNFMGRAVEFLPKIDCIKNHLGTCTNLDENKRQSRPNKINLYQRNENGYTHIEIGNKKIKNWKICDICRPKRGKFTRFNSLAKHYSPAPFWFKEKIPKTFSEIESTEKRMDLIREHLETYHHIKKRKDNLKIKIIPKFSKTFEECKTMVNDYEGKTGWKPEIIIIDYLDILRLPRGHREEKKHELIDDMWKQASAFAQEKEVLIITADQTTGRGRTKRQLDETITPEAQAKDHHVDKKIGIVKFRDETMNNICRVNIIYDRHAPFDRKREVLVTQDLSYGMAITDSVFWDNTRMPPYPIKLDEIA